MTTAAWHGKEGVLAVDTQVTSANRKFRAHKVARLPCGGLIAGTGNLAHILKVHRWVQSGMGEDRPEFEGEGEFECLIVKGDGSVWLLDDEMEPMEFTDEFIAIGSGGPYAQAAMHCGYTAEEAVKVAAKYDAATSEPVETYRLESPQAKVKRARPRSPR